MRDKDFLLKTYSQMYGPEAGPWNLGVENKYLEYKITAFFEAHFPVQPGDDICNIGIGAGAWDRYLSYCLKGGALTSLDIDPLCCRQLREGLSCEENPNNVEVLCADAMSLNLTETFAIVTLVGSTLKESGQGAALLEKAMSFVSKGGSLYLQTLDSTGTEGLLEMAQQNGMELSCWESDDKYGFSCCYYKFTKA